MILDTGLNPKIITNTPATIELTPLVSLEMDYNESDFIMHKSVITGKHTIKFKGCYTAGKVHLQGFTYALYLLLKPLRGQVVSFYPYGVGTIVIGSTTYDLPFITMICTRAKFYHADNKKYKDGCLLEFISESYYELGLIPFGT